MSKGVSIGVFVRARTHLGIHAASLFCGAAFLSGAWAADLVDIRLDSASRRFSPENPVQHAEQQFGIDGPGILTVEWFTDPHHGTNGGHGIAAEDGSPLYLGREVIREETPKPMVVGSPYRLKYVIMVPKAPQPLEASLTAWWAPQAFQIMNHGDQLGSSQRLKVSFVAADRAVEDAGAAPAEVDIAGTWRQGDIGQTWTFTPRGDGLYDAVEAGYGNAKGVARVSGRTVTLSFENTIKYGKYSSGIWIAVIDPAGQTASAGWLTDDGDTGTFTWIRQTAGATPSPPAEPVKPIPPEGPAKSSDWETTAVEYRGRDGMQISFACPSTGVASVRLWGTDLYTDDSSVCTAAAHAGLITLQGGGTVTIEIRSGAGSYAASSRNGIVSQAWGQHPGSFVFAGGPGPSPGTGALRYRITNYWKEQSFGHVYTFDPGRCTITEPSGVGTALELTAINFSVCRKDERLTFSLTHKSGYVVEYDWVLGDGGRVVHGAYKDSNGGWGPSFGTRIDQ